MEVDPVAIPDTPPKKARRRWVHGPGRTAEEKLAALKAKREAVAARKAATEDARRARVRLAQDAAQQAEKALARAVRRAAAAPDPDNTPDRQAARKAARVANSKAKGKARLPGRQRAGSIDSTDVALILALKEKEATNREIAKALNIGPDTVAKVLLQFADTRHVAKAYLQSKADQIAKDAVDASHIAAGSGKADVSLELLDRLDVAPKRVEESSGSKTVIIVGSANQAALPSFPSLDVKSLTQ